MTPFGLILHFSIVLTAIHISMPNLNILALFVPEILGGPKIPMVRHLTPIENFWANFAFFIVLTAIHL